MSFLPFSLTFSYAVVGIKAEQTPRGKNPRPTSNEMSAASVPSITADADQKMLSPSAQKLQDHVRQSRKTTRDVGAQDGQLRHTRSTGTGERLGGRTMDEGGLRVLLEATIRIEGQAASRQMSRRASRRRLSSDSFDYLGEETLCPSPKVIRSSRTQYQTGSQGGLGISNEFDRSLLEERRRRGASKIARGSALARTDGGSSVVELMKHFEELHAKGQERLSLMGSVR